MSHWGWWQYGHYSTCDLWEHTHTNRTGGWVKKKSYWDAKQMRGEKDERNMKDKAQMGGGEFFSNHSQSRCSLEGTFGGRVNAEQEVYSASIDALYTWERRLTYLDCSRWWHVAWRVKFTERVGWKDLFNEKKGNISEGALLFTLDWVPEQ